NGTMPGCAAVSCSNKAEKGFFMKRFPKDLLRRKQRENKAWQHQLYKEMQAAGEEETQIAIEKIHITTDGNPYITVICNGGWSKRTYGHGYSASSGVDLKEVIVFPREEKRRMKMTVNPTLDLKEFSDAIINEAVENALEDVLKSPCELGIIVEDLSACYTAIPLIKSPEDEEDVLIDNRMIDTNNGNSIDANRLQNFTSLPIEETDDNDLIDTNSDMRKDLFDISSAGIIDDLIMRSYNDKMAHEIIEEICPSHCW
ncbi:hypothetical protein RN001_004604, partial [Aquatica leii]